MGIITLNPQVTRPAFARLLGLRLAHLSNFLLRKRSLLSPLGQLPASANNTTQPVMLWRLWATQRATSAWTPHYLHSQRFPTSPCCFAACDRMWQLRKSWGCFSRIVNSGVPPRIPRSIAGTLKIFVPPFLTGALVRRAREDLSKIRQLCQLTLLERHSLSSSCGNIQWIFPKGPKLQKFIVNLQEILFSKKW